MFLQAPLPAVNMYAGRSSPSPGSGVAMTSACERGQALGAKLSTNYLHRVDSASSMHNLAAGKKNKYSKLKHVDSNNSLTNQI